MLRSLAIRVSRVSSTCRSSRTAADWSSSRSASRLSATPAPGQLAAAAVLAVLAGACTAQGTMSVAAPPAPRAQAAYAATTTTTAPPAAGEATPGTESYQHRDDNREVAVREAPLSTFSIDVDTASYSNIRRFLSQGRLPPADAVRIEEMINYFHYRYPDPAVGQPASVSAEVAPSPFHPGRRLLRVGIQGRRPSGPTPPLNLVFLIDTSGSMAEANKLPLVTQGLRLLAAHLGPRDHVGIVVYAGGAGVVLEPTGDRAEVEAALGRLSAGGSTNGGAGIQAAYRLAQENLDPDAINRVVLCTDGDFNVGVSDPQALVKMIEDQRSNRGVPDRARLRHRQPQGLDDGGAGPVRQRQLWLRRFDEGGQEAPGR